MQRFFDRRTLLLFLILIYLGPIRSIMNGGAAGLGDWIVNTLITIPGIMQTIGIMFIMAVGGLLNAGYDQILLLQQPANLTISQVLDTYVLQTGLKYGKFELATAIGLFKSVFSLIMVVVTNYLAQRFAEVGLW